MRLFIPSLFNGGITVVAPEVTTSVPISLMAAPVEEGIQLNWTLSSAADQSILVERAQDGGGLSLYQTLPAGTVSYTDTSVVPDVKYTYRVYKNNTTQRSNRANSAIVYGYPLTSGTTALTFPNPPAFLHDRTDSWSYETWVKFPDVTTAKTLFGKYDTSTLRGISISLTANGRLSLLLRGGASANQILVDSRQDESLKSGYFSAGKWYHIIITYSGTGTAAGVRLYIDGKNLPIIAAGTLSDTLGTQATANTVGIGIGANSYGVSSGNQVQGLTRLWSQALTAEQVATLYNGGLPAYGTPAGVPAPVLAHLVTNDTYAAGSYTLVESVNGLNGTGAGFTGTEKGLVSDLDAIEPTNYQAYTGDSIYYDTFQKAGMGNPDFLQHSPFTAMYNNKLWYASGVTGGTWMSRGKLGWNRENRIFTVQHSGKYVSPSAGMDYVSAGTIDGHPYAAITYTKDNEWLVVHEDVHNSILYIKKTAGRDLLNLSLVATIGSETAEYAYPVFAWVGNDLYIVVRGGVSNVDMEKTYITKSSDNGVTWSTPKVIVNLGNGSSKPMRSYTMQVYDPNKLRMFVMLRDDNQTPATFNRNFYIESADGDTWTDVFGSYSKLITSSAAAFTRAEMNTSLTVYGTGGAEDVHMKCAVKAPSGNVFGICNNIAGDGYVLNYVSGGVWTTRPVNLSITSQNSGAGNTDRTDYWLLYAYSDTRFLLWRIEPRNGFRVIVQYETTDAFVTLDAGTIISDADKNHEQIQITTNQDAELLVIAASQVTATTGNNIFLYEFRP